MVNEIKITYCTIQSGGLYNGISKEWWAQGSHCSACSRRRLAGGGLQPQCQSLCAARPTQNQRKGCLTFPLSCGATSAYFLPLVIYFLFRLSSFPTSPPPSARLSSRLIFPSSFARSCCFSVTPLWRNRGERAWKKERKKKREALYAVTMATASQSRASSLPQTCVLPPSFSLHLASLDESSALMRVKRKRQKKHEGKAALVREK